MEMAQSKIFLEKLSKAVGFDNPLEFIQKISIKHTEYRNYFNRAPFTRDPLSFFEFEKLGTRK